MFVVFGKNKTRFYYKKFGPARCKYFELYPFEFSIKHWCEHFFKIEDILILKKLIEE